MDWSSYFASISETSGNPELARWRNTMMERVFPCLKEFSWRPCLFVVDGKTRRLLPNRYRPAPLSKRALDSFTAAAGDGYGIETRVREKNRKLALPAGSLE